MVEEQKPKIKRNPYSFSPIFETEEDCQNNPFTFSKQNLDTSCGPAQVPFTVIRGNLLKSKQNTEMLGIARTSKDDDLENV